MKKSIELRGGMNKMQEKKLCPLLSIAGNINVLCDGNNCAWYNGYTGRCAVLSLTDSLDEPVRVSGWTAAPEDQ
jgi:hypothetical protein